MSNARNLSFSSRRNSLSSLSSSMESLSSSQRDSYCSIEHEWVPTSTSFTIPRLRVKTSDYDTGFSATEYDDDKKQTKKVSGRVRKVRLRALILQGWVWVLCIALQGDFIIQKAFLYIYKLYSTTFYTRVCFVFRHFRSTERRNQGKR